MISTATALTSAKVVAGSGPNSRPDDEGQRRRRHDGRHEPQRHAIDERLDGKLGALSLLDHTDDMREHRVGADRGCAEGERTSLVDGTAHHGRASLLLDRHRLARDHGFVDEGRALDDLAIHGNPLPGSDIDKVACHDVPKRHLDNLVIAVDARCLRLETDKALDRFEVLPLARASR